MTNSKLMTRGLTLALTLTTAALFLVPMTAAQQATLDIATPRIKSGHPIEPDGVPAVVDVDWTYTVTQQGLQAVGGVTRSTQLTWETTSCTNSNVIITGSLTTPVNLDGATAPADYGTDSGTSAFQVLATQLAPGETPIQCTFSGKVPALANGQINEAKGSTKTTVLVQYLGLISANVPTTISQAGPQKQIRYNIELTNLGNSRSNIRFDLEGETTGGWKPVEPTLITLESSAQGGAEVSKTVSFLVSTPYKNGWNNKEETFKLVVTPVSTKPAATEGQAVEINVLARVRGVYVPTLEPMLMLGAILGAALVIRMRRDA